MTKSEESVILTPAEWLGAEKRLRQWKLLAGIIAAAFTCLATGAAWVRSDERAEVLEQVRKEDVSRRLTALEGAATVADRRLRRQEKMLRRLLQYQGLDVP